MKTSTKWIDSAKLLAILAVMTGHCQYVIYTNNRIAYTSCFSVSLFILCMGITSFWSYERYEEALYKKVINKCVKIIIPYAIATVIYVIADIHFFDWDVFVNRLLNFNASAPFYYVCLYLGLVIVSPVVYVYINWADDKKHAWSWNSFGFLVLVGFSVLSINYSNIKNIYGGGGVVFGGTYIILLYIGMLFGKYMREKPTRDKSVLTAIVTLIVTITWIIFIWNNQFKLDSYFPFGKGLNPPGISLMIYAILIFAFVYSLGNLVSDIKSDRFVKIYDKIAGLGKHTLYIFLYHRLFIDYLIPLAAEGLGISIETKILKALVYFIIMISGSISIEYIFAQIKSKLIKIYVSHER